jgi:hydroxyacylglutathione hydrolase
MRGYSCQPVANATDASMAGRNALEWTIHAIPILADNYAWALVDGVEAIVIDPGESAPVEAWLDARSLTLGAVMLTHHHGDHIEGMPALLDRWPQADTFGPNDRRIAGIDFPVARGDCIHPAGESSPAFDVLEIPGHTSSHIAFHGHGLVFCGDTLFSAGCGRMFEGSAGQMLDSLDALAALPAETRVCCGHEYTAANCAFAVVADPDNSELLGFREKTQAMRREGRPTLPSTIALERAVNPFLRIDTRGVRDTLIGNGLLHEHASRSEAFAALRGWKDTFRG